MCFSNSIVSTLLNIPIVKNILSQKSDQIPTYSRENEIVTELILLNNLSNLSYASTEQLRSSVSSMCEESGQIRRTFSDNLQHDAGEFLVSLFEHIFKDSIMDEEIFGGLYQEKLVCKCGNIKHLPVQKLSEILMIQLHGHSIESCLMDFLSDEDVKNVCTDCGDDKSVKRIEILTEPTTLMIQLKRYEYHVNKRKALKRHDEIECPTSLTMPSGSSYTLSSVINHIGSTPTDGHYNVLIYDKSSDSHVLLDDLNVSFDVENTLCYIVSYTKDF